MEEAFEEKLPHKVATYKLSDGRERQVNSDHSEVIRYPNGNKEFRSSDGHISYYIAEEGTSLTCFGPRFLHHYQIGMQVAKKKIQSALRGY